MKTLDAVAVGVDLVTIRFRLADVYPYNFD